jgi:hypothetical protein
MRSVDWKKWAAIAEVFGTLAVVVSLIFVGISIRQNTAVVQANQQNLLYELTDNWFSDQVNNPELFEIESKAADPESLTYVERRQFETQTYRAMNVWENAYFNHKNGLLTDDQYQSWHNANAEWIGCCLPRWVWDGMKENEFDPDFGALVDAIFEKHKK